MKFQRPLTDEESYDLGRELFILWVELGSASRMTKGYEYRHPEERKTHPGVQVRRAKHWWIEYPEDGFEILHEKWPFVTEEEMQKRLMGFALTFFKKPEYFFKWLEKNPWAEKYERFYKKRYG